MARTIRVGGEKAGSGIDKILLPPEALERLRARFGPGFEALGGDEVLAVVTAEVEGQVSNSRLQQLTDSHPRELTAVLRGLVERGLLVPDGRTVARVYRTSKVSQVEQPGSGTPPGSEVPTDQSEASSVESEASGEASSVESEVSSEQAKVASENGATDAPAWRSATTTRARILELCRGRYLSAAEIAAALDRNHKNLRWRHINPLVKEGLLELRYPERMNHRDQAYRTVQGES